MTYDREISLNQRLNAFLIDTLKLPSRNYAGVLDLASLMKLKSTLSDINNLLTLRLSLSFCEWIVEKYQLDDKAASELRRATLSSKPNSNGFDVWLGYPICFVAEVKCNIPVNGGLRYGAQQRQGIINDVKALTLGKSKSSLLTKEILKFMVFWDLPAIREANKQLILSSPSLAESLVFSDSGDTPIDTNVVHGIYITPLMQMAPSPQLTTYQEFFAYCTKISGQPLYTAARRKEFTIRTESDALFFVPKSSGTSRRADHAKTEAVLKMLAESGVVAPGAYQSITYHASYIIAVANHFKSNGGALV